MRRRVRTRRPPFNEEIPSEEGNGRRWRGKEGKRGREEGGGGEIASGERPDVLLLCI